MGHHDQLVTMRRNKLENGRFRNGECVEAGLGNGLARIGESEELEQVLLCGDAKAWLKSQDDRRPANASAGELEEVDRGRRQAQKVPQSRAQSKAGRENGSIPRHESKRQQDFKIVGEETKWLRSEEKIEHGKPVGASDLCVSREDGNWKKVVYGGMQPGFQDNHTDGSFLEAMVMNANVVKRDTWTAVRDSVAISQYVCVVAMVAAVWTYSLNGVLEASLLLVLDAVLLLLGFMVLLLTTESISQAVLYRYALYFTFFVSGLYVLGPIFQTLTRSISSDSIWALTVCLLIVHLFFHDYTDSSIKPPASYTSVKATSSIPVASRPAPINSPKNLAVKKPTSLSGNVSLNASIVASVLIASRLPSRLLVFALLLYSSEFFLLFPLVTRCIYLYSFTLHMWFSCMLVVFTMALIFPLSRLGLILFLAVIVFITLVCPYWLIRIQEYKFEINGPWDEAKLCFDLD